MDRPNINKYDHANYTAEEWHATAEERREHLIKVFEYLINEKFRIDWLDSEYWEEEKESWDNELTAACKVLCGAQIG